MWDKVFRSGPSKIYGIQTLKNFTWFTPEYFVPYDTIKDVNQRETFFVMNRIRTVKKVLYKSAICIKPHCIKVFFSFGKW